ncbi:MAG: hypothetical protein AAFX76_04935 [Planctomycetota bacterium]
MRMRSLIGALVLAAAAWLPLTWAAPAAAESGAHRNPPPPVDTPLVIGERE